MDRLRGSSTAVGWCVALWFAWCGQAPEVSSAAPPSFLAKAAPPAAGDIDLGRSRVYIHVDKTGFGHEHGVVGLLKSGVVHLGATERAGRMVFDITSFVADTKEARAYVGLAGETAASTARQVTQNMLSADVLDAARFPTATFEIDSAAAMKLNRAGEPPRYELVGKLTLHGVTKALRFVVEAHPGQDHVRLRGAFSILQTSHGITPYSKALGAVGVADKLQIYGDVLIAAPAR
jgi:polyisoprenoid-binding protein YceI